MKRMFKKLAAVVLAALIATSINLNALAQTAGMRIATERNNEIYRAVLDAALPQAAGAAPVAGDDFVWPAQTDMPAETANDLYMPVPPDKTPPAGFLPERIASAERAALPGWTSLPEAQAEGQATTTTTNGTGAGGTTGSWTPMKGAGTNGTSGIPGAWTPGMPEPPQGIIQLWIEQGATLCELTQQQQAYVFNYYHVEPDTWGYWLEAELTVYDFVSSLYVMRACRLIKEQVAIARAHWGPLHDMVGHVRALDRLREGAPLSGLQYGRLLDLILIGRSLEEAQQETGIGLPGSRGANDPEEDPYVVPPFLLDTEGSENVSLNTGELTYRMDILDLPGRNGMDMQLGIQYNSGEAQRYKKSYSTSYTYQYAFTLRIDETLRGPLTGRPPERPTLGSWSDDYTFGGYTTQSAANTDKASILAQCSGSYAEEVYKYIAGVLLHTNTQVWLYNGGHKITDNPAPLSKPYSTEGYSGDVYKTNSSITGPSITYPTDVVHIRDCLTCGNGNGATASGGRKDVYTCTYDGILEGMGVRELSSSVVQDTYSYISGSSQYDTRLSDTYQKKYQNIGLGWSWNIPSVEIDGDKVYHNGNGGTFIINANNTIKDYTLTDMQFSNYTGYSWNGKTSAYRMSYKDGGAEYFTSDGRLLAKADRFGNAIHYTYSTGIASGKTLLTKITDTIGRETLIDYDYTSPAPHIAVTAPDGTVTALNLGKEQTEWVLQSVEDPMDRATSFAYQFEDAKFSHFGKSGGLDNTYANLTSVTYPTGGETEYSYTKASENLGSGGYFQAYKVSRRADVADSAAYSEKTYQYASGGYSSFPLYVTRPASAYSYATTVNGGGVKTTYTFNNNHLLVDEKAYGASTDTLLRETGIVYNNDKLPVKNTEKTYSQQTSGAYMERVSTYTYDSKGNLLTSRDPRAGGSANETEYVKTYTYDATYGILLTSEYKKDNDTIIKEENTLAPSGNLAGKCVESRIVYEKTGAGAFIQKDRTDYSYDSYGNIASATRCGGGSSPLYTEQYDYASGGNNFTGGANLTKKVVAGIQDSAGQPVAGSPGEAAGTLSQSWAYDAMGRVIAETAAGGGATQYQYDDIGNVTKTINPDNTYKTYAFDYIANTLTATDELGNTVRYEYDALGGDKATVDVTGGGQALAETAYDAMRRVSSLTVYHSPTEGSVAGYTYDIFGRIVGKTATDLLTNDVLAQESYLYDDAAASGAYQKITKTVHGDQDAPSVVTTEYKDKAGSVVKQGYFIGGVEYFDTFAYDYLGNVTQTLSAQDAAANRPHTAKWEYDFAGRVTKETNALNQPAYKTYDALGRNATATDYAGNATTFTYDVLDRLLKQEAPFAQVGGTTYYAASTFDYDRDGNVIREQARNNAPGATATWARTEYTYNNRNFLTGLYRYDGVNLAHQEAYTYDLCGNMLTAATGAQGGSPAVTTYTYDHLGNQLTDKDPLGNTESYACDLAGNVLAKTDRGGLVTNIAYDGLGRPTHSVDSAGREAEYTYTLTGQVRQERSKADAGRWRATEYTYDSRGQLAGKALSVEKQDIDGQSGPGYTAFATAYAYDLNGNLLAETGPDNVTTAYTYDALNRQLTQSRPCQNENGATVAVTASQTYNTMGQVATKTDVRGYVTQYTYNLHGLPTQEAAPDGGVKAMAYDLAGRLIRVSSPNHYNNGAPNTYTEYEYDDMDRRIAVREIVGGAPYSEETYAYDANGNLISSTDALGNTALYSYDLAGRLIQTDDPLGKATTVTYDAMGRVLSQTDPEGTVTAFTYDLAGNRLTKSVSGVAVLTNTYDLAGNRLTSADANGAVVANTYTLWGAVRSTTLPGDSSIPALTTTSQYDASGNLARQTDDMSREKLLTYDSMNRPLAETHRHVNGAGAITASKTYDAAGNVKTETDGNGNTTAYTYDSMGRVLTVTNPLGQTAAYTYDKNGNKLTATDWLGNTSTYVYDPLNRLVLAKDPSNTVVEGLTYDKAHRQLTSADALGHVTAFTYDALGRQLTATSPRGYVTSQAYDGAGRAISQTDGNNNVTVNAYDAWGNLISVTAPDAAVTLYTYDPMGNLLTQTDGNGNTVETQYNIRGKATARIDQAGDSEAYAYNADGSLSQSTDRNGVTTIYTYDIHGRLLSEDAGGEVVSYTYDNNGNKLTMTDSAGTTSRAYDALGRVTSKAVPGFGTTAFAYDITANLSPGFVAETAADPQGNVTRKTYDKAGRLAEVHDGAGATAYVYYPNGSLQSVTYPGGTVEEYEYYDDNTLWKLTNRQGQAILDAYQYAYDAAGNMAYKQDVKGTTAYAYDACSRLLTVTEPGGKLTEYTYDAAGNRLAETVTDNAEITVTTCAYDNRNRILSTGKESPDGSVEVTEFHYDSNGNMLSRLKSSVHDPDGGESLSFDVESEDFALYAYDNRNQMVAAEDGKGKTEYAYYGDGLRASKTFDGATVQYLYEYDKIVLEKETGGGAVKYTRNVYGINLISRDAGGSLAYYLYDGHHDVVMLVSDLGIVVASYYYDAFGVIVEEAGDGGNPYRYAGYFFDAETTLYYLKSRYYDAGIARFLTEDTYYGKPSDPLSLNLYSYCVNNPLAYWDPTGHYVSPTDKANLSYAQIARLEQLTKDWNAANKAYNSAKTTAEKQAAQNAMQAANKEANRIRASAGYSGGNNGNTITVIKGNTVQTVILTGASSSLTNSGTVMLLSVRTGATSTITNSGKIGTVNSQGTTTINNAGSIGTVNNSGTIKNINNSGNIVTINNSGTVGNIVNRGYISTINNNGTIGNIGNNGSIITISNKTNGKIIEINNKNTISNINSVKNLNIKNSGLINTIFGGAGSAVKIDNTGLIRSITVGRDGVLDGNSYGYVVKVNYGRNSKTTSTWKNSSAETMLMMNNQFILDYLVSKTDQKAGVRAARIGGKLYWDITLAVENALARDVGMFQARRGDEAFAKNSWFAGMVGDEGRWNLKYRNKEKGIYRWEETLGISFPGYSTQMVLGGRLVTVEDVGNITYGYLGAAAGFTLDWLKFNSALNHAKNHLWNNWGNEWADQANIAIGFNWYRTGRR